MSLFVVPCGPRPPRVVRPLPSQNLPSATAHSRMAICSPRISQGPHSDQGPLAHTAELCLGRTLPQTYNLG